MKKKLYIICEGSTEKDFCNDVLQNYLTNVYHQFPNWSDGNAVDNKLNRINFLENAMKNDISKDINYKFIPHLQLHEFETLLFCDINAFSNLYEPKDIDISQLKNAIKQFKFPEDINNSVETAPSKRLQKAIPSYDKVVDGNCIAMEVGINKMLAQCPHFREWIKRLKNI